MGAYQTKLIELTQANVQFAFDFSCRLATIRSPFHFVDVIVEFATRRADMLEKQATEMAALAKRATVLGSLTPRPDSSPH